MVRENKTTPPPSADMSRQELLARAQELRGIASKILETAGDLVLTAERMPGGSVTR